MFDSLPATAFFRLEPATDDDWPWILPRYAEAAFDALAPERRAATAPDAVQAQLADQVARLRGPEGQPHIATVAWDDAHRRAGFVWAIEAVSGFTGQAFVWVMCVYVEEAWRGQGLGRRLMKAAEAWGRGRDVGLITLNVAAWNEPARGLYESMDYAAESIRMSKAL
jgi:GNAT superfamily N-acetyltransferase